LTNPQKPGFLPAEDGTFKSDLVNGDQLTWNGGGEDAVVKIEDPADATFDEAKNNQTLAEPVTFDGISYTTGQIVTPTYTIIFNGSDGNTYTMTSFNFSANTNNEIPDAVFWEGSVPPTGTVLTVTSEINPTRGNARDYQDFVACFCQGTLIETIAGPKAVEHIWKGDHVVIQNGKPQKVLWTGKRQITSEELKENPKLRPVVVSKGAIGHGLPKQDLRVSRQHRLLVHSAICKRMFGTSEALVSAVHLTQMPGIYIDYDVEQVIYYHVLLEDHQVIYAEGAPTESLFLGKHTRCALSNEAFVEVAAIFPELAEVGTEFMPAHNIPIGKLQKKLVERHVKNFKPIFAAL
jgi:hypothetical protein